MAVTQTILLTGAFGNIGGHVLKHLLDAGRSVVCLDLATPKSQTLAAGYGGRICTVWGDLRDPAVVERALDGIDAVIHMAAIIPPVSELNEKLATEVNVSATETLIRLMEASPSAKRLVFASSMTLGGKEQHHRKPPMRVDEPPSPCDHYGRTKTQCEEMLHASELQWTILRIAACPPLELKSGSADETALIFESSIDGRAEFVHPDDAGLAFANAVACEAAIGKTLFVGGGKSCQLYALDFYNRLFDALGLGPLNPRAFKPGAPYFFGDWLDTAESQALLQFQRHSLDDYFDTLRRQVGWKRHLMKVIAPLANRAIHKHSRYLRGEGAAG
jgi:nucleoside-diphosphate-sugar epimerase